MARILSFLIVVAAAALIASARAKVEHPTPKNELRKRHPARALPPEPVWTPIFDHEQRDYLRAHNQFRRRAGVPPLHWNPKLTSEAHAWAEQRRGDCNYRSHSDGPHGESIFFFQYKDFTPKEVVQWWFNEYKLYDNVTNTCLCQPERAGCECGHYLNIVWRTTRRVGCSGATYCDDQKGVFVVCEYDPPGLAPGINPFTGHSL